MTITQIIITIIISITTEVVTAADTEDLNNQESKTNALKTGDHAPVIGTGIGMVLALSAIIVILKYRRSKNTITNTK